MNTIRPNYLDNPSIFTASDKIGIPCSLTYHTSQIYTSLPQLPPPVVAEVLACTSVDSSLVDIVIGSSCSAILSTCGSWATWSRSSKEFLAFAGRLFTGFLALLFLSRSTPCWQRSGRYSNRAAKEMNTTLIVIVILGLTPKTENRRLMGCFICRCTQVYMQTT